MKALGSVVCVLSLFAAIARAETIWIEGKQPAKSTMNRQPWWYDKVKTDQLSGGDWISNFADKKPAGEAEYVIKAEQGGVRLRRPDAASSRSPHLTSSANRPQALRQAMQFAFEPTHCITQSKLPEDRQHAAIN